ncbi:hypothetical protein ASE23_17635 [Rhizobium sp. Root73]|nr:hypothetical protein ASE23_17635 [Rhizobium sp. Root73]
MFFAALLRFFCAFLSENGVTTRHARFICEPEENHLSRSPGDLTRVSPNHPGTGPISPATQTGVSVMGRQEVSHGFKGRGFAGMNFFLEECDRAEAAITDAFPKDCWLLHLSHWRAVQAGESRPLVMDR